MTLRDAVVAIIANLDRGRIESHVAQLVELENQLTDTASAAREAAGAVGFMDKFNIFSKSQEEHVRDEKKKAEEGLRDTVASKRREIHTMIEKAIPPAIAIQCTIGDLERELSGAVNSSREAYTEYEAFSAALSSKLAHVRRHLDSQSSANGARSKVSSDLKLDTSHMGRLITLSSEACEAAHAKLTHLIEQTGPPLFKERLIQETIEVLAQSA